MRAYSFFFVCACFCVLILSGGVKPASAESRGDSASGFLILNGV